MPDEFFKKRAGTTDRGKDYEDLFISYIILDFIFNDEIQDFQISSNDENFGAFDDIVLEITCKNEERPKEFYALQLKHSTRPLTLKNMITKSGDFSIKKYHADFVKLKQDAFKWVILTNRKFNYKEKEAKIRMEGDDFDVKIVKYEAGDDFMQFCKKRCFYQLRTMKNDDDVEDAYEGFFQKFFLITDQLDVVQIETAALEKFQKIFFCEERIFRDYYKFVTDWSLREGRKVKLSKSLMKEVIATQIVSPFIKVVASNFASDDTETGASLLLDFMSKFHLTYFEEEDFEILTKLLGGVVRKFKESTDMLKEVSITALKYQVVANGIKELKSLSDDKCNVLLWILDLGHLVVRESESVYKALTLCQRKKFIILCQRNCDIYQNSSFKYLSNLQPEDVENISKALKCVFQGKKEISLESLLACSHEISNIITTSHLLQMVYHQFSIGEDSEDLPIPYIRRSVSRLFIDFKFLASAVAKTLIIITGSKTALKKHINRDINIINMEELFFGGILDGKSVYIGDECSKDTFNNICNDYQNLNCHQFRFDNEKLEWVRSRGGILDLKKFLIEDFVKEQKLLDYEEDNSINLICADAGMGKTTLLKNLKNNYTTDFWTILIYPKDHSKYFRQNGDDVDKFITYILEKSGSNYTDCEKKFLRIFYKEKRVNFFWDALDETSDANLEMILTIIIELRKRGYKQLVTSRNNLESCLESKFGVLSRTIKQFDEEEQRRYVQERLKGCQDDLEDIFLKINKNIQLFRYNQILGIPLQIYMFTELLLTNWKKYQKLLDNILSLTDLYACFVDEKFNVLHQEKENFDGWNDMVYKRNQKFKKDRMKMYEMVAMKLHFPNIQTINCDTFLEDIKTEADSVGIITHVSDDNVPGFWHNSYSEYFAALHLSEHTDSLKSIIKIFFDKKHTNIRFFFDLIMAKGHPAHISVLYKNIEALKTCEEEEVMSRDRIGRNVLQVACSWGEHFLELYPEKITKWGFFNAKYKVVGIFADSVKKENEEYCRIVELVMEKIDPEEKDGLFQFSSFQLADQARCLTPLNLLSKKYDLPLHTFENFGDVATLVYYACVFDLSHLLDVVEALPVVEDEFEVSVVFAAVKYGSLQSLLKLIKSPYYRNVMSKNKSELLKSAFDNKHYKVAEILLTQNTFETELLNELLLKHIDSHLTLIQLLVDNGADLTATDEDGHTPLFRACIYQNYQTVNFLIAKGAPVPEDAVLHACGEDGRIAELLIQNGAKADVGVEGKTALSHLAERGYFDTLKVLVKYGAKVNDGDRFGVRPIHYACVKGRKDVVEKLVDAGADVNVRNDHGFVPLHYACGQQFVDVVELLVEKGANVDVADENGETILDYAVSKGNRRIIEALKRGLVGGRSEEEA